LKLFEKEQEEMEHENEQEQEQEQRQEQERVQAQGLRPRVARVSAAVAVERIDKTLGTLPKLKKTFANMREWNLMAASALRICLTLAQEADLVEHANYTIRTALALRLPEEASFWLTCWYHDNMETLADDMASWLVGLQELVEEFSPSAQTLREEWVKLRQTDTIAGFADRIKTLANLLNYGGEDCLHKFLSGLSSEPLRSELTRLQLREPLVATFNYLVQYSVKLDRLERAQRPAEPQYPVISALDQAPRQSLRPRTPRYGCYNCGRQGHQWRVCRSAYVDSWLSGTMSRSNKTGRPSRILGFGQGFGSNFPYWAMCKWPHCLLRLELLVLLVDIGLLEDGQASDAGPCVNTLLNHLHQTVNVQIAFRVYTLALCSPPPPPPLAAPG
jgi:hypothetical protein